MLTGKLWARYLHKHESQLRPVVIESVSKVLACGRFIMGYATWQCSNRACTHEQRIGFGCKSRFCNTCGKKATDQWIEQQKVVLPDTQWQHITFTMPSELWPLFKINRGLLGKLSALAAKTLQNMARKKGITPGIFTAIHTFGRGLNWNVHIHLSVTRGGLFDSNTQWKSVYFAREPIMKQWRYGVITLLREAFKKGEFTFPADAEDAVSNSDDFNRFLNQQYEKRWIVHFAKATKTPLKTIKYLGRYIKRPPLSMSRLHHYDGKTVVFNYLDHKTRTYRQMSCEAEEFIETLTQHIPEKGFRMIRYYGFLANRVRNTLLPTVYNLLNQPKRNALKLSFPALIKTTFGMDIRQCLLCKARMVFTGITLGKPTLDLYKHRMALALAKPIV